MRILSPSLVHVLKINFNNKYLLELLNIYMCDTIQVPAAGPLNDNQPHSAAVSNRLSDDVAQWLHLLQDMLAVPPLHSRQHVYDKLT